MYMNHSLSWLGTYTSIKCGEAKLVLWTQTFSLSELIRSCKQGRIQGAAEGPAPPLKLEKIWFFGVKSWFFTRNTPNMFAHPSAIGKKWFFGVKSWFFTRNTQTNFAPTSARRIFFKCIPPNLKSWNRPW